MTALHLQNLRGDAELQSITADAQAIGTVTLANADTLASLNFVAGDKVVFSSETGGATTHTMTPLHQGNVDLTGTGTHLNTINFVAGDTISVTTVGGGTTTFTMSNQSVLGSVVHTGTDTLESLNVVDGDTMVMTCGGNATTHTAADTVRTGSSSLTATDKLDTLNFSDGDTINMTVGGNLTTFTVGTASSDSVATLVTALTANSDATVALVSGGTGALRITATDMSDIVLAEGSQGTNLGDLFLTAGTTLGETVADVVATWNGNADATVILDGAGKISIICTDGGDLVLAEGGQGTNLDDLGLTATTTNADDIADIITAFDANSQATTILDGSSFMVVTANDGLAISLAEGSQGTNLDDLGLTVSTVAAELVSDLITTLNANANGTCVLTSISGNLKMVFEATDGGTLVLGEGGAGTNLDDLGFSASTILGFEERPKIFTVPAGKSWKVQSIYAAITTTGDAGTRQYVVEFKDDNGDIIHNIVAGVTHIASLTRNYSMAIGVPNLTTLVDTTELTTPLPDIWLGPGYTFKIHDNNSVKLATDDVLVRAIVQVKGSG